MEEVVSLLHHDKNQIQSHNSIIYYIKVQFLKILKISHDRIFYIVLHVVCTFYKFDVVIFTSHFIAILFLVFSLHTHAHITVELLEHDRVQHRPEQLHHVVGHQHVHLLLQVPLGVQLAHVLDGQLLGGHLVLLLQGLVIVLGQRQHLLHGVLQKKERKMKYFSGTERGEVVYFLG